MKLIILAFLAGFPISAVAQCFLGVDQVTLNLDHLTTKFEDSLLSRGHVHGSTVKDLTARFPQVQLGCFVTEKVSVSAGYMTGIKLGTNTSATVNLDIGDGKIESVQLPDFVREINATITTLALTYYTGDRTTFVRGFAGIKWMRAEASYRVSAVVYTDKSTGYEYSLSGLAKKAKTVVAPEVGALVSLTTNSQFRFGYGYYGPRAYQVSFGVVAGF